MNGWLAILAMTLTASGPQHDLLAHRSGPVVDRADDRGAHAMLVDETRGALRHVLSEALPCDVREARAGEAAEIVEYGEAPAAAVPRLPEAMLANLDAMIEDVGRMLATTRSIVGLKGLRRPAARTRRAA